MNRLRLLALHKRLCKELGITPCRVEIRQKCRDGADIMGRYHTRENLIVLYSSALSKYGVDPRIVLAHETAHHAQYKSGKFDGYRWKGRSLSRWEGLPRTRLPWEVDAVRYETKIAKREGWVR